MESNEPKVADDPPTAVQPDIVPKGSALLCGAMALQFAVGGSFIPFVTLLLRDRGLDFAQISRVFTASSATLLVFPFVWGLLADRFIPLDRLFVLVNALASAALICFAVQTHFIGLAISFALFFACFNPTMSLVNALCFHHLPNPREQIGKVRAWGSFGWILPFLPISLGVAVSPGGNFDFVVWIAAAFAAIMAVYSFWLPLTRPGARSARGASQPGGAYLSALRRLLLDPDYVVLLFAMFLMAGSFSLLTYYSPALLEDIGVPRPWIGPIQAIAVVFEIFLFQWQPGLIRRWSCPVMILVGILALFGRHLLFGLAESAWILSASYLLAGMVIVFFNMGVSVLVNIMATAEVRSTAQTLLLLFGQGLGPLFANAMAVHLSEAGKGLRSVFLVGAALAGGAGVLVAWRARQLNRRA